MGSRPRYPLCEAERAGTATVATFVRNLAIAGVDEVRSCAEAFADDE